MSDIPKSQLEKFIEAAREVGADDDEERFAENMKKIAKAGGKPDDEKPEKSKG